MHHQGHGDQTKKIDERDRKEILGLERLCVLLAQIACREDNMQRKGKAREEQEIRRKVNIFKKETGEIKHDEQQDRINRQDKRRNNDKRRKELKDLADDPLAVLVDPIWLCNKKMEQDVANDAP